MDDPIVALSLWQSQSDKPKKTPPNSKQLHPGANGENTALSSTLEKDCRKEKRSNGEKKSDTPGKCFPCLSGLDQLDPLRTCQKKLPKEDIDSEHPVGTLSNGRVPLEQQTSNADQDTMMHLDGGGTGSPLPQLNSFWLLRLFESNLFTMDIALQYLYREKDKSVQEYLGKKLFMFKPDQVDFYLLQLVSMFVHLEGLFPVLQKYFLQRCQHDVMFSLNLAWLLSSSTQDKWLPPAELQRASRLLYSIQSEQIRPPQSLIVSRNDDDVTSRHSICQPSLSEVHTVNEKSHHRSFSASGINSSSGSLPHLPPIDNRKDTTSSNGQRLALGDLRSGRAFDAGCTCDLSVACTLAGSDIPVCSCLAPRLTAQDLFLHNLGSISNRLLKYASRTLRTSHLYAELSQVNLNLPARVCLPLHSAPHQVVRIPASEAVILNSKSKAPYIVFVEVLECDHTYLSPLPSKQLESYVRGFGLSPDEAKHYIHSEGPSPSNTRASSMPSLRGSNGPLYGDNASLNSYDGMHFNDVVEEKEEREDDDREEKSDEDKSSSCSSKGDSNSSVGEYNPIEENNCGKENEEYYDDEKVTFSVGDIRRRLSKESVGPRKMFSRDPTDPSAAAMKEPWESKVARIQKNSPYGHLPEWKLIAGIVKWGDDLRQEMMCWQLLVQFERVWKEESIPLWIRPYMVVVLSSEGGLIEPVCNAVSLHQIKKQFKGSLLDYFKHEYGDRNSETFMTAQKNFVESCAAYCLVCYFIQVKDRHNGNILLDSTGHIIHIDFGFILANSPGNNIRFESSPFKLTEEFVEVMGGVKSDMYQYFKFLMLKGFLAARKHMDRFINIVEIAQTGSQLPCFGHGPTTIQQLRDRFCMSMTEQQLENLVNGMVETSVNSLTTKLYDGFQYLANGIL